MKSRKSKAVVLVGGGPLACETARQLTVQCHIHGIFTVRGQKAPRNPLLPHLGDIGDLNAFLESTPIDEVYFATDIRRNYEPLQAAVGDCERLGIPFALPAHTFRLGRALPVDNKAMQDGFIHYSVVLPTPFQSTLKRLFDIAASSVALLLLAPFLAASALAVKLSSRGPVFFKQIRVGLRGKHFEMYKFRSMVADAEQKLKGIIGNNEQTGPVFKIRNDPRITRVGRLLRKFSIDELPQLFNVLRGDMSIVGPRPPLPKEVAQYKPWQRRRLSVVPGLTCLWQVSGRNDIGFDEWMMLDLQYVDHWSLRQDASLIGRTVPVVVTGRGAS